MHKTPETYLNRIFVICMFLSLLAVNIQADGQVELDKKVLVTKNKGTIYELLKNLSEQSGYLFIYDSRIIENDRKVKVTGGEYSLREAIRLITGNKNLQISISGEYLLLRPADEPIAEADNHTPVSETHHLIQGALYDRESGEPILFASVGILNTSIGTITNQDGEFQLTVADSLQNNNIRFSHIGYESREIDISLLKEQFTDIHLKPQVISLQEIIVSVVNPEQVLNEMLNNRDVNYASEPVYLTTFYREGISHNDQNIDLTESVLRVYKTGYKKNATNDQVKLIRKRRLINRQETDTIFPKMRSGIRSCLILDLVKELPDFITPGKETPYTYTYTGKSVIDGRPVHILSFRQKEDNPEPMYTGELYIEAENKALAGVRFEINPKLADKATHMFVDKKTAGLKINLQHAGYIVSYKQHGDGQYYINHVRGDIRFKIRRKKRLFSSPLHFWFEMVTSDIETKNAQPFPANERLSTTHIFSETKHRYDKNFWNNFNIILPEEALQDDIIRNLNHLLIMEE